MKKCESLVVMVFSLFFLISCDSEREKGLEKRKESLEKQKEAIEERIDIVEKQKDVAEKEGELFEGQRELYREQAELRLDEFDDHVNELRAKARAADVGGGERVQINKEIDELVRKKEAVRNKLDELESVNAQRWENFKFKMDAAIDDLEQSYNRISSRLVK